MSGPKTIGRFRIDGELGQGGMGVVYRARDLKLDRAVAIKVLSRASANDVESLSRFEEEAKTLARFNHPNIATIYGLGETDGGRTFLVLELIEGETLDKRLRRKPLPVQQALDVCRQVAAALRAAHARGIVHRDLKPENISIDLDGVVKVLDFGLAQRVRAPTWMGSTRESHRETVSIEPNPEGEAGVIQGTPGYMSPEHFRGEPIDRGTDIFAFGCVLFECLSAGKAFQRGSLSESVAATLSGDPDWSLLPSETPARIRDLMARCLEKAAHQRLDDISRALEELEVELAAPTTRGITGTSAEAPNNLPQNLSSFVGRVHEIKELQRLIDSNRLVTIVGPGGCGKTRLSLRIAEDSLARYPDGVYFVNLAAVTDEGRVLSAFLGALGLREEPQTPPIETILHDLDRKRTLLLVDNCEHVLGAGAELAAGILESCPAVQLMTTSRERLGIPGEIIYPVPSLSMTDNVDAPTAEELQPYESIQLFLERARTAQPAFRLDDQNAPHVARICHRLNGIPLAIELAATRLNAMAPQQISQRLEDNFRLLTRGSRTALPRQQTMRAAFDWSYDLLTGDEKSVLCQLSVFSGGWTLEAAEAVCRLGDERDVSADESAPGRILDLLTSLVERSLVIYEYEAVHGRQRYRLLETSRQYAREELEKDGDSRAVRDRHLKFFLELAENANRELRGADQERWLDRLAEEHDNLGAALGWSPRTAGGEPRLRLATALWRYWLIRGHFQFGRSVLNQTLEGEPPAPLSPLWARAHRAAGALASIQGDYALARSLYGESLRIHRQLGDKPGVAKTLGNLGLLATDRAEYSLARSLYEESLATFRVLGDLRGLATALGNLGIVARKQGGYREAQALYEESLAIHRDLGNKRGVAIALVSLGSVAEDRSENDDAAALYREALEIFRTLRDQRSIATTLDNLGNVAVDRRDFASARALHEESLAIYRALGDRRGVAVALVGLISVATKTAQIEEARSHLLECVRLVECLGEKTVGVMVLEAAGEFAARGAERERAVGLYGAARSLRAAIGEPLNARRRRRVLARLVNSQKRLGEPVFQRAWRRGREMGFEAALRYARGSL